MTTYFKIDQALDNTTMRIIEDSIMLNPNIKADDKAAIITSLCYSMPYEVKEQDSQRYTSPVKYKSVTQEQVNIQTAAPELLEALKVAQAWLSNIRTDQKGLNILVDAMPRDDYGLEKLRAAIAKAEGK